MSVISRWVKTVSLTLTLAAGLIFSNEVVAQSSPTRVTANIRKTSMDVFLYRPRGCAQSQMSLLFVFHGDSRTASSYRDYAKNPADKYCMAVYSPLFDERRFPNWKYHQGGLIRNGKLLPENEWTVGYVRDLVQWARNREGRPDMPFYLFGHSAGGQFLSRVAAYGPSLDTGRIVIANPSTHVWPSITEAATYGFGKYFSQADATNRLRTYLERPVTIYLGELDTDDEDLAGGAAAERQGIHRLDRGQNTFREAQRVAQANGWPFGWRLVIVPGVAHSAGGLLRANEFREAFGLPAPALQK